RQPGRTHGPRPGHPASGFLFMSDERIPLPRPRCRRLMGVRVLGSGSYVPDAVVTNEHLHARFGFDSDWIVKRTGILERRHALPHQATSDLCHEAALRCIDNAGIKAQDIDLIVLATFTPDMSFPSTACLPQDRLKVSCAALEVEAKGLHYMHMDGRAVFRWAVGILCDTIQDVLTASGLRPNDIDLYLPHQANIRIINAAIDVLHIPRSKVFNNLDRYGNTSA